MRLRNSVRPTTLLRLGSETSFHDPRQFTRKRFAADERRLYAPDPSPAHAQTYRRSLFPHSLSEKIIHKHLNEKRSYKGERRVGSELYIGKHSEVVCKKSLSVSKIIAKNVIQLETVLQ